MKLRGKVEVHEASSDQERILKSFDLDSRAVPNYLLKYKMKDFFQRKVKEYVDYMKKKKEEEARKKKQAKKKAKKKKVKRRK